mmetsp:Transcript_19174/g.31901  ORF Transcript_19174/g.31901 Transcript_19174/m.31901 type:complete len:186 (+) Transcript_19174:414-971(+)
MKTQFTKMRVSQSERPQNPLVDEASHRKLWVGISGLLLTIILFSVKLAMGIGSFHVLIIGKSARYGAVSPGYHTKLENKTRFVNTEIKAWNDGKDGVKFHKKTETRTTVLNTDAALAKYKTGFAKGVYFEQFHKEVLEMQKHESLKTIKRDIELLMKEGKAKLYNATCLPAVCKSTVGFFFGKGP